MGNRIPSHQLSSGLYVSGRPEQLKERQPTMSSRAVPYTGGDPDKFGEFVKMFDIPIADPSSNVPSSSKPSRHSSQHNSGSGPNSGPIGRRGGSGPMQKKSSGQMSLHPTGLITSGPLRSGPVGASGGGRRSGHLELSGSIGKAIYGSAVTSLNEEVKVGFRVSKSVVWVFLVVAALGLLVGIFLMVAVKNAVLLVALVALLSL